MRYFENGYDFTKCFLKKANRFLFCFFYETPFISIILNSESSLFQAFYDRQENSYEEGWKDFDVIGALAFFAK